MVPLFRRLGPRLIRAGHRVLIERCLTPGGFFSDEAHEKVVSHAIARFEGRQLAPE
jgi:capsular polysaccharide export protein